MSKQRLSIAGGIGAILIIICTSILIWKTAAQAQPLLSAAQIGDQVQAKYPGEITSIVQNDDAYQVKLESATGVYELTMGAQQGEVRSIRQLQSTANAPTNQPDNGRAAGSNELSTSPDHTFSSATTTQGKTSVSSSDTDSGSVSQRTNTGGSNAPTANSKGTNGGNSASTDSNSSSTSTRDKSGSSQTNVGTKSASTATSITEKQAEQIALAQVNGEVDDVKFKHSGKTGQQYYLVEIDTPHDREAVVQINAISGAVMSVTWDDEDDSDDKDQ
ncbi:PepSY domain-containing protein [Paenibacillus sp. SGZ-1009]|uniref:PepSY domain-containing protein n=1 Tax=Paenibacillus campi TaxID=3106031 RepID=UPI002AFDCB97|nr:PepSY domain-containing protein [Paenibacillus sp. SGZ-1009]